ncbi:L-histidine N(alpha)-methyltransferase, partial [Halobacillus trueperi]
MKQETYTRGNITAHQEEVTFDHGILEGLNGTPKYIPSKYLYDEIGSLL